MPQVTISLAQMNVRKGNPRANWTRMQEMSEDAKRQGGELVVFPELWDVGYALDRAQEFASMLNSGLFAQVVNLSKTLGIHIIGSMMEKRGLGVANAAPIVSPARGMIGVYRKIHLFPLMSEHRYLVGGDATLIVDMPWGATALAICYDLRFPELFRRYALEGAKLVVLPSQWPQPRLEHFRTLLRARAIENGMYIVAVNRVGTDVDVVDGVENQTHFPGYSCIVDPWGNTVLEAGDLEGVFTAKIDLDMVDEVQRKIPTLKDRRPETYGNY
jgi:predicted amidohydrolase